MIAEIFRKIFIFYINHFIFYINHFTFYINHFTFYINHFIFYINHFIFYINHNGRLLCCAGIILCTGIPYLIFILQVPIYTVTYLYCSVLSQPFKTLVTYILKIDQSDFLIDKHKSKIIIYFLFFLFLMSV